MIQRATLRRLSFFGQGRTQAARKGVRIAPHMRRSLCAIVLCALNFGAVRGTTVSAGNYHGVNDSWDRFGAVYSRVLEHYYQSIDHGELMRAAIEGMLQELDSYSQFFDAEGLRQLRQDTTGKFAGLGITVGIKDHYPVVISPIDDTPANRAGLLPGDLIVAIEGEDTYGTSLEQIVTTLRGEPGSEVRITLARTGEPSRWEVVIERQTIKIKSVAVWGQIAPGVGYISMRQTRFSEETATEVEAALKGLLAEDAASLILDLRGNPGGLLSQATQVADLFLPTGDPIVSIRERNRARTDDRSETRYSQRRPLAADLPLVVLIDGGSASAAEIVAGAIQDNDRGLILGTTSFGKGSVQTIFELRERESAALKLTTALYYTPSGRSIHRQGLTLPRGRLLDFPLGNTDVPAGILLGIIATADNHEAVSAQLRARFGVENAEVERLLSTTLGQLVGRSGAAGSGPEPGPLALSREFATRNGRSLLSGGGIVPDVRIEVITPPSYVRELQRRRIFFDFVVDYIGSVPDSLQDNGVDDRMLSAFKEFIPTRRRADSQPRSEGEAEVEALRSLAVATNWAPEARAVIDSLEAILQAQQDNGRFSPGIETFVRSALNKQLVLRLSGKEASLLAELESDVQVEEAVAIIGDLDRYERLLRGS